MNRKIQCVTLPRSGHHLLVNCLLKYFSKDVFYPETKGNRAFIGCSNIITAGEFNYCEYYSHCLKVPCSDPKTNFQKNHDFSNRVQNRSENFYIIQYRHPLEYLVSHYLYEVEGRLDRRVRDENCFRAWMDFLYGRRPKVQVKKSYFRYLIRRSLKSPIASRVMYWKRFINKWILNNKNKNVYYLSYSDFVSSPKERLKEVISFIAPSEGVDVGLIESIFENYKIKAPRDISEFVFYESTFFARIERYCSREIEQLRLKKYFI